MTDKKEPATGFVRWMTVEEAMEKYPETVSKCPIEVAAESMFPYEDNTPEDYTDMQRSCYAFGYGHGYEEFISHVEVEFKGMESEEIMVETFIRCLKKIYEGK